MHTIPTSPLLRGALFADAAVSGLSALTLIVGAGVLSGLHGLPQALLFVCGLLFVPFSATVAFAASRREAPVPLVWAILIANAGWAVASIAVLFTGWLAPTTLGMAFVIIQAIVVAGFAELQFVGLRRQPTVALA